MADKLVAEMFGESKWRIYWYIEEDEDLGGHLGQSSKDGTGDPPKEREDWEHWAASRAVVGLPSAKWDNDGLYFERESEAKAALRIAKAVLKTERPLPEWAKTALAAGWKMPSGWKP